MKKKTFIAVVLSIISVAVFGQEKIKDVRTNPTLYLLCISSSLTFLSDKSVSAVR